MTRPINAALPTCHNQNIEFICEYFGDTVNQWRHAEKITMSHIKMNAIYWATCSLALLDKNRLEQYYSQILSYVQACWNIEIGGFSQVPDGEVSMLATLSAIQILILIERFNFISEEDRHNRIINYVFSLQEPNGSWVGDSFGEVDTRFSYSAFAILALLGFRFELENDERIKKAISFVNSCRNTELDGGYGVIPMTESHSGQIFCCVSFLSIIRKFTDYPFMDLHSDLLLKLWLALRQSSITGGLNGRPEKLVDVCYSWWVLSSLYQLDAITWIDKKRCIEFIFSCQDMESGGFSDRPGDVPDLFHTFFALCGLSLLRDSSIFSRVDAIFCLPTNILETHLVCLKTKSPTNIN